MCSGYEPCRAVAHGARQWAAVAMRWLLLLQGFEAVMESLHRFPGPIWDTLLRIGRNALAGPLAAGRAPAA